MLATLVRPTMRKWLYHGPGASNPKSKPTLFPTTLKVEVNKMVLVFGFGAQGPRYSHVLILGLLAAICGKTQNENTVISGSWGLKSKK